MRGQGESSDSATMRLARRFPGPSGLPPIALKVGKFLCVGVVGLAVDTLVFWFAYRGGASAAVARALSLTVATLVTWLLNRLITFEATGRGASREFARYSLVALVVQGFNYLVFLALMRVTQESHPLACLFTSAVLTTAFSFTAQNFVTFARAPAPLREPMLPSLSETPSVVATSPRAPK